ncbi:MAG: hypothetical protein R3253_07245, partial [Longimicrobiales bacterium]|nr:hypothetical protein [Longimicrobiales bacterium]
MDSIAGAFAQMLERAGELLPEILAAVFTVLLFAVAGHLVGTGLRRILKERQSQNRYVRILTGLLRAAFALIGLV